MAGTGLPANVTVDIAFGNSPSDASPTWVNIPEIQSVNIGPWGRTYELDSTAPTPASIVVDSSLGAYANTQRWNLCPNPSFEVGTTGWFASNGNTSIARVNTTALYGSWSLRVTATSAATTRIISSSISAVSGVTVAVSFYVKASAASRTATLTMTFNTAAGASNGTVVVANATALTSGSWTRVSGTCAVPANSATMSPRIEFSTPATSEVFYVDGVLIEQSTSVQPYFDGSNIDAALSGQSWWNSTTGLSTSTFDGRVTIDTPIRVQVTDVNSNQAALYNGIISASPTNLDSGSFDYATTRFSASDQYDLMGCIKLRTALVEQTIAQKATAYYILNDLPGASTAGESITGNASSAIVSSGVSPGGSNGSIAFGATSLCEPQQSDPTTSVSFAPHKATDGSNDGGYYLRIGNSGTGSYLTGSQWSLRAVFAVDYGVTTQSAIFCQTGSATLSDVNNKSVLLSVGNGYVTLQYPHSGSPVYLNSATNVYNDALAHTVEARMSATGATLIVDGVSVATNSTTCDSLTAVGPVTIGCSLYSNLTGAARWFQGRIGHVALFGSSFNGAYAIDDGHNARLGYPNDYPQDRLTRLLQQWGGFAGILNFTSNGSVVLGTQSCAGSTIADEILKVETASAGTCIFTPSLTGIGAFSYIDNISSSSGGFAPYPTFALYGTDALPVDTQNLVFEKDRQHLVNDVSVNRPGGPTIRLTDATSIAKHGRRTSGSTITFYCDNDAQLKSLAQTYLDKYSKPRLRVGSINVNLYTLDPTAIINAIPTPGSRIAVTNLPTTAPATTMDFVVESVSHSITPTSWVMTLALGSFTYW